MKCSQCNTEIPANSKFCGSCGSPAPAQRDDILETSCPSCGTKVESHESFCPQCGTKVKESTSLVSVNSQTAILQVTANDYEDSKNIILPNPIKKKSPFLAIFLTFMWPGLGHVYNGQTLPGLIIMAFTWYFLFGTSPLILAPVYWSLGHSAFDAAMDLREGRPIHKWMKKVKPKGRTTR